MAEVIDTLPADDRFCVWVCPTHGVIAEGELAEGVNWAAGMQMDGDVCWTDTYYCQRDHAEGEDHEARLIDVKAEIVAALPLPSQEVAKETE